MYYVKHRKNVRSIPNMSRNKLIFFKISFFSITLINRTIIDTESPVKNCLEVFFNANSMDHLNLSLFLHYVSFLYTSLGIMPHRFSTGLKSGLLADLSRSFTELTSKHERDPQDT